MVEQPLYNLFHRQRVEMEYKTLYKTMGLGITSYSGLAEGILAGRYVGQKTDEIPEDSRMAFRKEIFMERSDQMAIAEEVNAFLVRLNTVVGGIGMERLGELGWDVERGEQEMKEMKAGKGSDEVGIVTVL